MLSNQRRIVQPGHQRYAPNLSSFPVIGVGAVASLLGHPCPSGPRPRWQRPRPYRLVIVGPGGSGELDKQENRAACVAVLDKLLKKDEADTNCSVFRYDGSAEVVRHDGALKGTMSLDRRPPGGDAASERCAVKCCSMRHPSRWRVAPAKSALEQEESCDAQSSCSPQC